MDSAQTLEQTRFWQVFDLAAACGVSFDDAYRALVQAEWDADAARRALEEAHRGR